MSAPCPSWCVRHWDDYDSLEPSSERRRTRLHEGTEATMRYRVPGGQWVAVSVMLERFDFGNTAGTVAVRLNGTEEAHADHPEFDAGLNNAMTVQDAARFAEMLQAAIAGEGPTEGPESHAREINRWGRGVPMVECRDCPTAFDPDSSPHPDRRWECAERVDGEVLV